MNASFRCLAVLTLGLGLSLTAGCTERTSDDRTVQGNEGGGEGQVDNSELDECDEGEAEACGDGDVRVCRWTDWEGR
jgi:hypothetical protein